MSRRKYEFARAAAGVAVNLVLLLPLGCATDATSVEDVLSSLGVSESTTLGELLNQITIGDTAAAYASFADAAAAGGPRGFGAGGGLTEVELAEIESLQASLDDGTITESEFHDAVYEIIGDRAPGMPFADRELFGGPFRGGPRDQDVGLLDLSDEQIAAAEEIRAIADDDIEALEAAAREEIRALLTEEQLAQLDALTPDPDDAAPHPGFDDRMGTRVRGHIGGRPGQPDHMGHFGGDQLRAGDWLFAQLDLTDEQQTQIDAIRTELREAIEARHEEARQAFVALLTEEQLALLPDAE